MSNCLGCSKIKTLATFTAPFVTKGKKERQTWSWSSNYPRDRLIKEARDAMSLLASQMWGNK